MVSSIKLTQAFVDYLKQKNIQDKVFLLVADDGGGKYSLRGGACTIGSVFNLVMLDEPDAAYPIPLNNDAGVKLYSSTYNLYFLEEGLVLDVNDYRILLRDNAHQFENDLQIVNGAEILAAFEKGIVAKNVGC